MVGVSRETVLSLLVRVGEGCEKLLDCTMRNLKCECLELDEIGGSFRRSNVTSRAMKNRPTLVMLGHISR